MLLQSNWITRRASRIVRNMENKKIREKIRKKCSYGQIGSSDTRRGSSEQYRIKNQFFFQKTECNACSHAHKHTRTHTVCTHMCPHLGGVGAPHNALVQVGDADLVVLVVELVDKREKRNKNEWIWSFLLQNCPQNCGLGFVRVQGLGFRVQDQFGLKVEPFFESGTGWESATSQEKSHNVMTCS